MSEFSSSQLERVNTRRGSKRRVQRCTPNGVTDSDKGGQTREHAILAKTQGVNQLCVVINKMDDPTVEWSHDRYKECTEKLSVFLRGLGYAKSDIIFMRMALDKHMIPADM